MLHTIKMRKWERMRDDRKFFIMCPLGIILIVLSGFVFALAIMSANGMDGLLILGYIAMATFIANCVFVLRAFDVWHPEFKNEYLADYKVIYGNELRSKCCYILTPLPKPRQALV